MGRKRFRGAGLGEAAGRAAVVETVQEAEARFLPFWESAESGFVSVMPRDFQESLERYQTWRARVRGVCELAWGRDAPGKPGCPSRASPDKHQDHRPQHPAPPFPDIKVSYIKTTVCLYTSTEFIKHLQLHCQFFMGNNFSPCPYRATY